MPLFSFLLQCLSQLSPSARVAIECPGGAIISRQQGRQCWKEIVQHNFSPSCPNVSFRQMTGINCKPYCPLHFHPEEPRGTGKKKQKPQEGIMLEKILLTCIPECTEASPWWFGHRGGGRADSSSSHLISRSPALCWTRTSVG